MQCYKENISRSITNDSAVFPDHSRTHFLTVKKSRMIEDSISRLIIIIIITNTIIVINITLYITLLNIIIVIINYPRAYVKLIRTAERFIYIENQ